MAHHRFFATNQFISSLERRRLFSALFGPITAIKTGGSGAEVVVSADFNGDTKPDTAVGNFNDGTIDLFLNQGKGKFVLAGKLTTNPAGFSDMAVSDFNSDGKPDLAVVGSDLQIFIGLGGGKFAAPVAYAAGTSPQNIVVGNFVKGGKPDLAVTDVIGDAVLIFKNDGAGKFGAPTTIGGIPGAAGIVAGDFTGDKKIDLAVATFGHVSFDSAGNLTTGPTDGVRLLVGHGDGFFTFGSNFKVYGNHPTEISAADLNGDGKLDLITSDGGLGGLIGTPTVSVLENYGGGHFAYPRVLVTGASPQFVTTADINHDGRVDIVTADEMGNDISLFTARPGSSFSFNPGTKLLGIAAPVNVIFVDVNGDKILDLLTESNSGNTLDVLLGI